ncbi:MAG: hypothetical protein JXR68_00485 [Bacteroidales bacterium]|nr:hypothetical protein [Bacteroidales bacterium]
MDKSLEILQKINWFIKPISDFIIFIFTTKLGIILFILSILFFLWLSVYNNLKQRKLIYKTATNSTKIPLTDFFAVITEEIIKIFTKIISNITVLIVVLFLMLAIVGLSTTFTTLNNFFTNQQKIKELSLVVKNLNQKYKVAKIEILEFNPRTDTTKLNVKFFDYASNSYIPKNQTITIPGHDIYFLTYVMNFGYSEIENGENINIAIPYLIFSEKLAQSSGIHLNLKDDDGVPYIFHRDTSDLYGVQIDTYNKNMKQIIEYMNNPNIARKAGIRSSYSAAPHFVKALRAGQTFVIWIEQTGGLVIKQDD